VEVNELQNLFAYWVPESKAALGYVVQELEAEIEARGGEGIAAGRARSTRPSRRSGRRAPEAEDKHINSNLTSSRVIKCFDAR
jgi:hypothetical protein